MVTGKAVKGIVGRLFPVVAAKYTMTKYESVSKRSRHACPKKIKKSTAHSAAHSVKVRTEERHSCPVVNT
jgi:hypothetical protein